MIEPGQGEPIAGRPSMPAGYGIAPSTDGLLSWDAVREQLVNARNYWIATTSPDGRPHAMPVWGLWLDDAFYFGTDPTSRKGRNLSADRRMVIHLESGDDVVIVEGVADPVSDPSTLLRFSDAYEKKYAFRPDPSTPSTGVYRVRARVAFAWRENDYPQSATRWRFPSESFG